MKGKGVCKKYHSPVIERVLPSTFFGCLSGLVGVFLGFVGGVGLLSRPVIDRSWMLVEC